MLVLALDRRLSPDFVLMEHGGHRCKGNLSMLFGNDGHFCAIYLWSGKRLEQMFSADQTHNGFVGMVGQLYGSHSLLFAANHS